MDLIILILEIIGTIAFAVSGAIIAIKKELDIFGIIFLAILTASGGGITRDVIIGNFPPNIFENYIFALISTMSALIVFLSVKINKQKFLKQTERIDNIINVFDALGLGVFTVNGMNVVLYSTTEEHNAFLTVFVGLCTGIGGGILRDTLINNVPFVLKKRVYAIASIAGGILYYALYSYTTLSTVISMGTGILFIFIIRMLATKYKWNLPKISLEN